MTEISEKALSVAGDIDRRIAHEPNPENRATIIAGYLIAFAALTRVEADAGGCRWEAIDEEGNDNFATSIYEAGYKGLLVARCNQNGNYPWQAAAIIRGLEANKFTHPTPQPSGMVKALTAIDEIITSSIQENGQPHRLKIGDEWHTGPAVNALYSILMGLRMVARSALTAGKPEQSGWQPIETAPADGRAILVYEARSAYPIHLRPADGDWWRKQGVGPSHWMPLPAAPTAGGRE